MDIEFVSDDSLNRLSPGIRTVRHIIDGLHVYWFRISIQENDYLSAWDSLSIEEQLRASRYVFDKDRRRFVMRRALLRSVLAHYAKTDQAKIAFRANRFGKLSLDDVKPPSISFSLSFSDDAIAICVGLDHETGIDVERHRDIPHLESMAGIIMDELEKEEWLRLPDHLRPTWFFSLWAMKEAVLKCIGTGLAIEPSSFSVQPASDIWQLVRIKDTASRLRIVRLKRCDVFENFSAAIAVEKDDIRDAERIPHPTSHDYSAG